MPAVKSPSSPHPSGVGFPTPGTGRVRDRAQPWPTTRRKASSARYEDRTKGPAKISRPSSEPTRSRSSNSSGFQYRSTGTCAVSAEGTGRWSRPGSHVAEVAEDLNDLVPCLTEADHEAGFRSISGARVPPARDLQRPVVAPRAPHLPVASWHGLDVVVVDLGPASMIRSTAVMSPRNPGSDFDDRAFELSEPFDARHETARAAVRRSSRSTAVITTCSSPSRCRIGAAAPRQIEGPDVRERSSSTSSCGCRCGR